MRKIYKGLIFLIIIIILFIVGKAFVSNKLHQMLLHKENSIGDVLDSYKEVNVFIMATIMEKIMVRAIAKMDIIMDISGNVLNM